MAEGPFPCGWMGERVIVELNSGGGRFVGVVSGSNEQACIVKREIPEGGNAEPVTRRFFYPWASIRSIRRLTEPEERGPFRSYTVVRHRPEEPKEG